jgi:hypothetical protein
MSILTTKVGIYYISQTLVDEASLYQCGESHKYGRLTFSNAISGAYFDTFPAGAGLLLDISASMEKHPQMNVH